MIIPIRCISCGKPVADLWEKYKEQTDREGKDKNEVLTNLGLKRYCCRALFLSHVNLMDTIAQYKKA